MRQRPQHNSKALSADHHDFQDHPGGAGRQQNSSEQAEVPREGAAREAQGGAEGETADRGRGQSCHYVVCGRAALHRLGESAPWYEISQMVWIKRVCFASPVFVQSLVSQLLQLVL
jgi:hypothetical protein